MTDGWSHAPARMRCFVIQWKLPNGCCGCCAKVRCAPSKAATSRCAEKQFAFMAIRPEPLNSRVNCVHTLSTKARESARQRECGKTNVVILSEAKNLRSFLGNRDQDSLRCFASLN